MAAIARKTVAWYIAGKRGDVDPAEEADIARG